MKKIIKILAIAVISFGVLFSGAYFFVKAKGKEIFTAKMSDALEKPVTVGSLRVIFPLGLSIKDLDIKEYGYIKEARLGFGVLYLFSNYFSFSSLVLTEPQIVIQRTADKKIIFGDMPKEETVMAQTAGVTNGTPENGKAKPFQKTVGFSFDKLIVKNGKIHFSDYSTAENPVQALVDQVNLKAQNVSFPPKDVAAKFALSGLVKGPEDGFAAGKIESRGWINLAKKDMKSEFHIENLDGKIFSRYFGGKSINKSVKSMSVNLSADLESKNNDMSVKGKFTVDNVVLDTEKDKDAKPSFEDLLLGGLQSMAQGVSIEFNFKTKMDSFKIDSFSFSGNIFN